MVGFSLKTEKKKKNKKNLFIYLFAALGRPLLAFVCTWPFIFSSLHTPRGKSNCRLIDIPMAIALHWWTADSFLLSSSHNVGLLVQVYDSPSSSSSVSPTLKKFHRSLSLLVFLPLPSSLQHFFPLSIIPRYVFPEYRWIFVAALLPQGVRLAWRFSVRCFSILLSLLSYEQYDQG